MTEGCIKAIIHKGLETCKAPKREPLDGLNFFSATFFKIRMSEIYLNLVFLNT